MRTIRWLLIYFVGIFVGAALLAPWLYKLAAVAMNGDGRLPDLSKYPFHRFVSRSVMILAVVGLWPLLRKLQIQTWSDLGFTSPRLNWKNARVGFTLGFGSLAFVAFISICFGARAMDLSNSGTTLAGKLLGAMATALIVSIIEETLFRGVIYRSLRKVIHPWPGALLLSSGIYSLIHFFTKATSPESVEWNSGFSTLASMLAGFGNLDLLIPGFINLFIVGLVLGMAYERTGNLYFSIGLHAGWIFWLKSYGMLTTKTFKEHHSLWGTAKLIDGWLATAVLAMVFAVLVYWRNDSKRTT